jgi:hypothetical protein
MLGIAAVSVRAAAAGPESVFTSAKVTELFAVIEDIRQRAVA